MKSVGRAVFLAVLGAAIFLPPTAEPREVEVRWILESAAARNLDRATDLDRPCPPDFARFQHPDRESVQAWAFFEDLAYAIVDGGPVGALTLILLAVLPGLLFGMWCRGLRCGLRRLLLTLALAGPVGLALMYYSCFLPGRRVVLTEEARLRYAALSPHVQTNRSTGLLSPRRVLQWHWDRGFDIVNVSDRDTTRGGEDALRSVDRGRDGRPDGMVLVGEEWHGSPDLVLVNVRGSIRPRDLSRREMIERVHREGGAVFVAHPWSKVRQPLDEFLKEPVDGVEVVNGVVRGGVHVFESATKRGKALLGSLDYKYGPHVTAITLIPRSAAGSPRDVVKALRDGRTRVVYAIPGGAWSGASYEAQSFGPVGVLAALRTLYESPRARRVVWFLWLAGICLVFWFGAGLTPLARPNRAGLPALVVYFVLGTVLWWLAVRPGGREASGLFAPVHFGGWGILALLPFLTGWRGTRPTPVQRGFYVAGCFLLAGGLWMAASRAGPMATGLRVLLLGGCLALGTLAWWLGTDPRPPATASTWRATFLVCGFLELALLVPLGWQVRASLGSVPVIVLLGSAALVAVPLLASSRMLALVEAAAHAEPAPSEEAA